MIQPASLQITQQNDINETFLASTQQTIALEEKQSDTLQALRGNEANETAQVNWRSELHAVVDHVILQEIFQLYQRDLQKVVC